MFGKKLTEIVRPKIVLLVAALATSSFVVMQVNAQEATQNLESSPTIEMPAAAHEGQPEVAEPTKKRSTDDKKANATVTVWTEMSIGITKPPGHEGFPNDTFSTRVK